MQPREAAQINRKAINRLARDFRASVFFQGAKKLSERPVLGKHGNFRIQFPVARRKIFGNYLRLRSNREVSVIAQISNRKNSSNATAPF
jgi:hypothetical protein